MVRRRAIGVFVAAAAVVAVLACLRDPPWLIDQTSGLRGWEQPAGEPRYRWSSGHASFFVPADAGAFDIPVSLPLVPGDDRPMLVSVSVDDTLVARAILSDASWTRIHVVLPPPGSRRVRRVDLRTGYTRDERGVRVGALEFAPRLAGDPRHTRSGERQRAYPVP